MKLAFIIFILLITNNLLSQSLFIKKTVLKDSTLFALCDSVQVTNGHDEKVKIFVEAFIPKTIWNNYILRHNGNDSIAFEIMVNKVAIDAQYQLKNPLSFEPMKKQYVIYFNNSFASQFKLMGRNGYGNLIENTILAQYKPID